MLALVIDIRQYDSYIMLTKKKNQDIMNGQFY